MYYFHLHIRDEKIEAERLSNLPKDIQLTGGGAEISIKAGQLLRNTTEAPLLLTGMGWECREIYTMCYRKEEASSQSLLLSCMHSTNTK